MPRHAAAQPGPPADDRPPPAERVPLVHELFQVHHMMMRIGDRLTAEIGLTASRWLLICAITELEVPTISELSEQASLSPQAVSRMVAAMEAEGLVRRERSPTDARSVIVRLTDRGQTAADATTELGQRFLVPFLEGFDEARLKRTSSDIERLIQNLSAFEDRLESSHHHQGPRT
jgi:DNA-binding MarR family transcriptional regulator